MREKRNMQVWKGSLIDHRAKCVAASTKFSHHVPVRLLVRAIQISSSRQYSRISIFNMNWKINILLEWNHTFILNHFKLITFVFLIIIILINKYLIIIWKRAFVFPSFEDLIWIWEQVKNRTNIWSYHFIDFKRRYECQLALEKERLQHAEERKRSVDVYK